MVAYNFQQRFVEPIVSGWKTQTIRRIGKRRHARRGDMLQLYTGMRQPGCRKIVDDRRCLDTKPIEIEVSEGGIVVSVDSETVGDLDYFARSDGFQDAAAFHEFWLQFHGVGTAEHLIIFWAPEES